MSIEAESNGKTGQVCKHAKVGSIQCPLLIRPTSEDVITANVFGLLKHIRPHLWINPLLSLGLGTSRFDQVWFRKFQIQFWKRLDPYPPELLNFREGRTEADILISWENPPTTMVIEAKYLSPLSRHTANSDANDQAIRGIRTLLAATGHITSPRLFHRPRRNAVWLALLCSKPEPMVDRYRDWNHLIDAIGKPAAMTSFPPSPFIGTITWRDICNCLRKMRPRMTPAEQSITDSIDAYLHLKLAQANATHIPLRQLNPAS